MEAVPRFHPSYEPQVPEPQWRESGQHRPPSGEAYLQPEYPDTVVREQLAGGSRSRAAQARQALEGAGPGGGADGAGGMMRAAGIAPMSIHREWRVRAHADPAGWGGCERGPAQGEIGGAGHGARDSYLEYCRSNAPRHYT